MIAVGPPARAEVSWHHRFVPRLAWLLAWGTKGSLALADQALFAGAQFVLNILLARWLAPAEYGAFAVAYSVFLLAAAVHSALLIEPMMVFGSGKYLKTRHSYLGIVLRGHWLLTVPVGLILFGVGFLVGRLNSQPVGHALCALGVALPLILLAWLTRQASYIELQPGHAAAGGAVFFCTLLVFVQGLRAVVALTPATAVLAMGAAASLATGLHLMWLRPRWLRGPDELMPRKVALQHWRYGRWVLGAVFPSWTLLNLYYLALPIWFGLGTAGAFKALMNLAMPAIQALIAFAVLTIPLLVRHRDRGGNQLMWRTAWRVMSLFVAGAAAYFAVLRLFRVQIITLLYGDKYLQYSGTPVLLLGLVPLVMAFSISFGIALRAYERPDRLFWGNVAASVVALSLGLWMAATWGVAGAAGGCLVSYAVFAGALWFFCHRLRLAGCADRGESTAKSAEN